MVPTDPGQPRMMAHACDLRLGRSKAMHMALKTHRWTRADLERMPEDGNKFEVIDGALLVSPAPRPAHDALVRVFWRVLSEYCERTGVAHVSGHLPVFVAGDSETIPDIVVREPVVPP